MTATRDSQKPSSISTDDSVEDGEQTSRDCPYGHPAFSEASAEQRALEKTVAIRQMLDTLLRVEERHPGIEVEHALKAGTTAAQRELKQLDSSSRDDAE